VAQQSVKSPEIASESKSRPAVESREEKLSCDSTSLIESRKAVSSLLLHFKTILHTQMFSGAIGRSTISGAWSEGLLRSDSTQ